MSGYNAVLGRNTDLAPQFIGQSSQTVAFSHYNNFSAQLPIDPKIGQLVEGGILEQSEQCFKNIENVVKSIGHVMNDVVRLSVFVTDIKSMEVVNRVFKSYFTTYMPTRTNVVVDALPMDAKIQVEVLLTCGEGTIPNAPQSGDLIKLANNTSKAPLCALSTQTVAFSHYNNLTTQIGIDPETGRLVVGDVQAQASQCLKNIKSILRGIDVPFDDIVKINIFLKDLSDLDAVNEVYTRFFPDSSIARAVGYMPARTVVEVKAIEMDALVQMEVVVSHGDGTPPQLIEDRHGIVIEANNTDKAPISDLSSQTVAFSHYNHISGQLGLDPKTGQMVAGDVAAQARQCLSNIKAIIESVDHKMEDMVKVNIYLKDLKDLQAVEAVYSEFFPGGIPARRVVGVSRLEKDALIQMDAVAGNEEGTPPVR